MADYGPFPFDNQQDLIDKSIRSCHPDQTRSWQQVGADLGIGKREDWCLYELNGRRRLDLHLNGGTFNLGHRQPELVATLNDALDYFDLGNYWFPSVWQTAWSEALIKVNPGMTYLIFGAGGAEAVDIANKSACYATKCGKIVSILKGYHSDDGLSVPTGDLWFAKVFWSDQPDTFIQVAFNDFAAMEQVLATGDIAALIMETILATYGFPTTSDGYLGQGKALSEKYGALYFADEVQIGMMRYGQLWGWQTSVIQPDILITAMDLSGGLNLIFGCLVNGHAGEWLNEDRLADISTASRAELGCEMAHKVIEILHRPETIASVGTFTACFQAAMADMMLRNCDIFTGVPQLGFSPRLEFDHAQETVQVSSVLYDHGVWAIFAALDKRVLQSIPGVLLRPEMCADIMKRFDAAMPRARELMAAA